MIDLRSSRTPDVTVAVLVTREPAMVGPSLEAVARALPSDVATEVVLVLNTERADTRALLADGVRGARVIVSPANCGTAVGWNVAVGAARAPYVAIVHEDTHPRAGWIEGLLAAARAHPRAFLLGSRILHTDGAIWSGGWITWRDGWTTPLDARSAPQLMAATNPYVVDWVGTASMLLDRAAFQAIGGFDEWTFPAVSTNIGLGMAGTQLGRTSVATPHSAVVHATQAMVHTERGLYSSRLYREFLIGRSTRRMREKWGDVLDADYESRDLAAAIDDPVEHDRALAATIARAERAPADPPPPSRQSRELSAPGGGWPDAFDEGARDRLLEAQREVDAAFDAWVLDDRKQLRARILELDAGAREASRAHADAVEQVHELSAECDRLRARVAELDESARDAARAHDNALEELRRAEQSS